MKGAQQRTWQERLQYLKIARWLDRTNSRPPRKRDALSLPSPNYVEPTFHEEFEGFEESENYPPPKREPSYWTIKIRKLEDTDIPSWVWLFLVFSLLFIVSRL